MLTRQELEGLGAPCRALRTPTAGRCRRLGGTWEHEEVLEGLEGDEAGLEGLEEELEVEHEEELNEDHEEELKEAAGGRGSSCSCFSLASVRILFETMT